MVITFSCVCVWFLSRKKTARLAIYITDISPVKRHQGKNEKTEHILKVIKPSSRIAVSIKRGTGNKLPDPFFFSPNEFSEQHEKESRGYIWFI